MRRIYTLMLTALLGMSTLFTGCQSSVNAKNEVAMGRYLEETIKFEGLDEDGLPEMCFFENAKGEIEAITCHAENTEATCKCYQVGGDKVWQEVDEVLADNINKEKLYTLNFIKKDKLTGDVYVVGEKETGTEIKLESGYGIPAVTPYIARIKEDSTLEEVTIDWKIKEALYYDIEIARGKVFAIPNCTFGDSDIPLQQYDLAAGKFIRELGEDITEFTISGDYAYIFSREDRDVIKSYDINTGKKVMDAKSTIAYCEMIPTEDEKGIYLVDTEGIYYLAQDESLIEEILDGDRYSLSTVTNSIIKDGVFYIGGILDSSFVYKEYAYHDDVPLEPEETVTIFSLENCSALKRAARIYMEEHPNVYVDFKAASTNGGSMDREVKRQAIEEVNTQILAGTAADIIVLDGLPIQDYIEKGILGDMNSIAEELQANSSCYVPMINAYKENEKLYALPLAFNIISAVGENEVLKEGFDLEALAAYQKQHPEKQVLANMVPEDLLEMMSSLWQSKIIDAEGKVDTGELTILLEAINTLAPMKEGMTDCYEDKYCFPGSWAFQAEDKKVRVMLNESIDADQLQVLLYAKDQIDNSIIADKIEGQENVVKLNQLIGINAASDKQEAIREILMLTFSKEGAKKEENNLNNGISIYQDIAEEVLLGENEMKTIGDSDDVMTSKEMRASFMGYREGSGQDEIKDIQDWYTEDVNHYIEHLKNATVVKPIDDKVLTILQEESEDYFKGSISVDEAVQHIKAKMDIYLSEQSK